MQKKFMYAGLLLLAAALIIFVAIGTLMPFKDVITRALTATNLSISSGGFSFVPITTSDTMMIATYTMISGNANMYLFNDTAFRAWSSAMQYNRSASGIALARSIASGNHSVIVVNSNSSQILLSQNASSKSANQSTMALSDFNGTAYIVVDNSKGSASYNGTLRAVVSYFRLTQSNLSAYTGMGMQILVATGIDLIVAIAGIALLVYGALKKPEDGAVISPKLAAQETASKEYIDALYKKVGKRSRRK